MKQDPTTKRLHIGGTVLNDAKSYGDVAKGGEILTDAETAALLGTISSLDVEERIVMIHLGSFIIKVLGQVYSFVTSSSKLLFYV